MTKSKKQRSPRDGWILLQAGEKIIIDLESPTHQKKASMVRNLRGCILSDTFNIENTIEVILINYFNQNTQKNVEVFKDSILRQFNFNNKIRAFEKVYANLDAKDNVNIIKKLDEIRRLRNVMAHEPCWLEPITDKKSELVVEYRALISDGKKDYEVNDASIKKWGKLINDVLSEVEKIAKSLEST